MKKIGILYICTGAYSVFWKDFFDTFEQNFLPNIEKHYFVFTDAEEIYMEDECERVKRYYLETQPWPLVTLLRFHTFLSIEDELKEMDYLMFSNSNMICENKVLVEEFLPREEKGETLSFTEHPGYKDSKMKNVPFDRNPNCTAYIPYNCGEHYVIGAMFAGESKAFLTMSRTLRDRINEDLKKNVIAKWHDESQINRYIVGRTIRLLSPSYCYPWGMKVEYQRKISAVSKQDKFDVNTFKGVYQESRKNPVKSAITRVINKRNVLYIWDCICHKSLDVI